MTAKQKQIPIWAKKKATSLHDLRIDDRNRGIFPICCLSPGTPVLEMSLSENLGNFPDIQWLINGSQSQILHGAGIFANIYYIYPKHHPVMSVNMPYMKHMGMLIIFNPHFSSFMVISDARSPVFRYP